MTDDSNPIDIPTAQRSRSRSYSFGWNPVLGGFPKPPKNCQLQGEQAIIDSSAIPHARSGSISSGSDSGSDDLSFKESYLTTFARRGSIGAQDARMFKRRPSLDEERILKGEFSF